MKTVIDAEGPCACKVEIEDGVAVSEVDEQPLIPKASARIIYCPMHAHCGEMHSILKSLDLNTVNSATSIATKNVLAKMERAKT